MKKTLKLLVWLLFMVYFVVFMLSMIVNSRQPEEIRSVLGQNQICEFILERSYCSDLSDYGIEGNSLYLLWGDIGVLEVYSLDGKYQKSFAFETIKNGEDRLEISEGELWLKTKNHRVYCFHDGHYLEEKDYNAFQNAKETGLFEENREYTIHNGSKYERFFDSIRRVDTDGSIHPIVKLSLFSSIIHSTASSIIHVLVIALLIICAWCKKHNKCE